MTMVEPRREPGGQDAGHTPEPPGGLPPEPGLRDPASRSIVPPVDPPPPGAGRVSSGSSTARSVALRALEAVDNGAYANLALPELLRSADRASSMSVRDKAFATELTYGTVRMRRACDWLIERHISRGLDAGTRRVLQLGAYQLVFLRTPPHAGVSATVDLAPRRSRGFVNAVLRKIAGDLDPEWPDFATSLSYPDWIFQRLTRELGEILAMQVMSRMNEPAMVTRRFDGYVQDPASQMVGEFLGAQPGERVLDLCAAPGGKATAVAQTGALVLALDLHPHRVRLIADNVRTLGLRDRVFPIVADAINPPFAGGGFERVLVDAPCSGLGSLRRRADARWRITEADIADLVVLQRGLLRSAADQVCVGGWIVYSACTLTSEESTGIDAWVATALPQLEIGPRPVGDGWEPLGRGSRLLPGDTDGMIAFTYRRSY